MIKEIYNFDLYEDFIKDFSGNAVFADPHFEFDSGNLYNSLTKAKKKLMSLQKEKKLVEYLFG